MISPGNRHCANRIGTLSIPIDGAAGSMFSDCPSVCACVFACTCCSPCAWGGGVLLPVYRRVLVLR